MDSKGTREFQSLLNIDYTTLNEPDDLTFIRR